MTSQQSTSAAGSTSHHHKQDQSSLVCQILTRFETLYPLLAKQKLKESGKVQNQSFITPANGPAKGIFQNNRETNQNEDESRLSLRDRLKIISTLAKSEVETLANSTIPIPISSSNEESLQYSEAVRSLEQAVLPALDQICQQTSPSELISEQGLFFVCILVACARRHSDLSTCSKLLTIMKARSKNYVVLANAETQTQNEEEERIVGKEFSLKKDTTHDEMTTLTNYVLLKGILKPERKAKKSEYTIQALTEIHSELQLVVNRYSSTAATTTQAVDNEKEQQRGGVAFSPAEFAPTAIEFEVLLPIFEQIRLLGDNQSTRDWQEQLLSCLREPLSLIMRQNLDIVQILRLNSQKFLEKNHKDELTMKAHSDQKQDRWRAVSELKRSSTLYGEILGQVVKVAVNHLRLDKSEESIQGSLRLIQEILATQESTKQDRACFTLIEQLGILKALNSQVQGLKEVWESTNYWGLIKAGIADIDPMARKLGLSILKENLGAYSKDQQKVNEEEFQLLWTTFFDLMDTMESFGSHLIKCIWHRVDVFYQFLRTHDVNYRDPAEALGPLEDFRMWLLVLYQRLSVHQNMKIRKFVQKETLKREFITPHMRQFFFKDFLQMINSALIFKDVNYYTQFSRNAESVVAFYNRYFEQESSDIESDLRLLFQGITSVATHPQTFLIGFKLLGNSYGAARQNCFFGNSEMVDLERQLACSFYDQYFSSRYLCMKFIQRMLAFYAIDSRQKSTDEQNFNWSRFFAILGYLPLEFFSKKTVHLDEEGLSASSQLIDSLHKETVREMIGEYLIALFTVKALPSQMPKFGGQLELISKGLANLILILANKEEEQTEVWFTETIFSCVNAVKEILGSTYVGPKVTESKIQCFTKLVKCLFEYGPDKLKNSLINTCIEPILPLITARFSDYVLLPLSKAENSLVPSEKEKLDNAFANYQAYVDLIGLGIRAFHLTKNQSESSLESFIEKVLQLGLRLATESEPIDEQSFWHRYLQQFITFQLIQRMGQTYSTGIEESIKKGISYFMVPDDMFTVGNTLLNALISFKPQLKGNGSGELTVDQRNYLLENSTNSTKFNSKTLLALWHIKADFVSIFVNDQSLKVEIEKVVAPQLASQAQDMVSDASDEYSAVIYRVLRLCYLPLICTQLKSAEVDNSLKIEAIEQLQKIAWAGWAVIKGARADIQLEPIKHFVEFVFSSNLLQAYESGSLQSDQIRESLRKFHSKIAKEMIEHSSKYWLILRTFFNHLMFTFATKPHLMNSFESFLVGFGTTREMRSLDAEIKLHKLQTLIPEVIPKRYEDFTLEYVSYQGAYIRTMTLMVLEGIINNHLTALLSGQRSDQLHMTANSLEGIVKELLEINFVRKITERADQPYSEGHRMCVRTWQYLVLMVSLLNPQVYTEQYRAERMRYNGGFDVIQFTIQCLWKIIKMNHVPTVRQYIEIFAIKFMLNFPDLVLSDQTFCDVLLDPRNVKPQVSSSMLLIVGHILTSPLQSAHAVAFKRKIFESLLGFCTANSAHSRCIAQYFMVKLQDDSQFGAAYMPAGVLPIIEYLQKAKDTQKLFVKYAKDLQKFSEMCLQPGGLTLILSTKLDPFGEFIGEHLIETLRSITAEELTCMRTQDIQFIDKRDFWKNDLQERIERGDFNVAMNEDQNQNYQKKILPWEDLEKDIETSKAEFTQRPRNQIIMCASLIDKIPNLAGLSRTCEIMNASSLLVDNGAVVKNDEFKAVAVTSEKWLPIYQVQEQDLLEYLAYQKSNGYKVLGLEQTANSQNLHEFDFPDKCILLLGKEKEGIPQEYYAMLDECIEIPQFGIIRSLNVHVSGALCLWEYTKQQMLKKKNALQNAK